MRPFRVIWIGAVTAALGLTGCATSSRFEWGNYDTALYVYSKHPEQLPVFEKALQAAIAKGRAEGRIAPGLQAELGYCYLGEGKRAEAVEEFKGEMADFPESRLFLTKIVTQSAS